MKVVVFANTFIALMLRHYWVWPVGGTVGLLALLEMVKKKSCAIIPASL